jgi:hypothetical protein
VELDAAKFMKPCMELYLEDSARYSEFRYFEPKTAYWPPPGIRFSQSSTIPKRR